MKKLSSKIYFYLKSLLHINFIFSKPPQKKFLIFDGRNSKYFYRYFKKKDCHILYSRLECINLYILIKNFFRLKFSPISYLNEYVKIVNPKIIITLSDHNPTFYKIASSPNRLKVFCQYAYRSAFSDIFSSKIMKSIQKKKK